MPPSSQRPRRSSSAGSARPRASSRSLAHAKALEPNAFAALLSTVQDETEARLSACLDSRLERAEKIAPEVGTMVSALSELCLRGGKRLRPALLVAGYRAASARADLDIALDAGVALELLQAYFLIHDDWMDGDIVRRGGPSVHALLGERFQNQRLGDASAILAGDYAVALATELLAELDVRSGVQARVFACFARMQLAAVAGQQIDLVAEAGDIELAYALKTGSYTVQGPLELGALLASGSTVTLRALERFARPLGIAFQLRDDLLGAFGDPSKTGKPLGNDLRAGKRTLLLAAALERARPADRVLLGRVVGNRKARDKDLRAALEILEKSGARAAVEARIAQLSRRALKAIGRDVTVEGRELLTGAVELLAQRRT